MCGLRRAPPDLFLRVRHEAGLAEELQVLADVGACRVEAGHVVRRTFGDDGIEQLIADLGRHRAVRRVELGDDPVVAVRLLDGPAAADQLALHLRDEVHRRCAQRQP